MKREYIVVTYFKKWLNSLIYMKKIYNILFNLYINIILISF